MVGWIRCGNCLKYLKIGWNRKKGGETKVLKRRSKLGQGVGALKMNGSCNPITKYVIHALNVLLECIETNTFSK